MALKINWLIILGFAILIIGLTAVFVLDDVTVIGYFLNWLQFPFLAVIGGIGASLSVKRK